jgi:hypothetical protein
MSSLWAKLFRWFKTILCDRWTLALGGVLALASFLRLFRLGRQALFLDEAWSWMVSRMSVSQILQLPLADPHPPFYYLILKFILLKVPSTETGLRLFSVFCSLIALVLLMMVAARLWGKPAAFFAGWSLALSSFDIYYAQEARMYALLGLLWLASMALLLEALSGHPRLFLPWGLVNAAMMWTHFYSLLVVGVHLAFAFGIWVWKRRRGLPNPAWARWFIVGSMLTLLSALPVLIWLWKYRLASAGGAWLPKMSDLSAFLTLLSLGLSPVRDQLLDSSHLTLPWTAAFPAWLWQLGGVLFGGGFALWGLWQGWRAGGNHRRAAALSSASMFIPVGVIFVYALASGRAVWAYKPFLGTAYLFYLWWGVGSSRFPSPIGQGMLVVSLLLIAALSLIPYYTGWQKSEVSTNMRNSSQGEGVVLLERAYFAPLVFYYLGNRQPVWGLNPDSGGEFPLVQVPQDYLLKGYQPLNCADSFLQKTSDLWAYGLTERVLQAQKQWPSCLQRKRLWFVQDGKWTHSGP